MDILKSNIMIGITAAIAATVLAPVLVPALTTAGRPLAKSLIRSGILLYEKAREGVAESGEILEDLVAEVRSEMGGQQAGGAAMAAMPRGDGESSDANEEAPPAPRHNGPAEAAV